MFTVFEVGKYYKWFGGTERPANWNPKGGMDFMLSGRPFLCVHVDSSNPYRATFELLDSYGEEIESTDWDWEDGIEYIEGVDCFGGNRECV